MFRIAHAGDGFTMGLDIPVTTTLLQVAAAIALSENRMLRKKRGTTAHDLTPAGILKVLAREVSTYGTAGLSAMKSSFSDAELIRAGMLALNLFPEVYSRASRAEAK